MKEGLGGALAPQYYEGALGNQAAQLARLPTIKERCEFAVKQAEERLALVKEARALLDKNPDLERLLDIMQQSHF